MLRSGSGGTAIGKTVEIGHLNTVEKGDLAAWRVCRLAAQEAVWLCSFEAVATLRAPRG